MAIVPYVNRDELRALWRVLERLQADVTPNRNRAWSWVWRPSEVEALITVMDAVKDTYQTPPLYREDGTLIRDVGDTDPE